MKLKNKPTQENKPICETVNLNENVFMVKIIIKNSEISGYTWLNNKPAHLDTYIQIKAYTLKEAVDKVMLKYGDKNKYWIKVDESYMILD